MKLIIDTDNKTLTREENGESVELPLYSKDAFEEISRQWVRVGWNEKYQYSFSWMGRPIIQLPEDMIRTQEVIWNVKPDVIIETGIAHGGSLIYNASLCKAMGKGRVIGIDIEIRPHNRAAVEAHPMAELITMIEGSSTAPEIVAQVKGLVKPGETVLI
ncbi:MAG: hydroxylase, partial [Zetaproteobacteria bacterium CG23_combo_of_CG06-09_8_20_14_all_54_7]